MASNRRVTVDITNTIEMTVTTTYVSFKSFTDRDDQPRTVEFTHEQFDRAMREYTDIGTMLGILLPPE